VFPGELQETTRLVTAWRASTGDAWPEDEVAPADDEGFRVRLTVLSRSARQFPVAWEPIAYVLEFDSSGRVRSWAWRVGQALYEPSRLLKKSGV